MNLVHLLLRTARWLPDAPALALGKRPVRSYREMASRVSRLAFAFKTKFMLKAGDRVALAEIGGAPEAFFDRLVNGAQELGLRAALRSGSPQPKAIGIAVPGLLDADQEAVLRSVNLPFLERIPLRRMLEERLDRRVTLTTDAQACCLAEYQAHRPRVSRFVHLRFGTGIGCAVVRGNQAELLRRDGLCNRRRSGRPRRGRCMRAGPAARSRRTSRP